MLTLGAADFTISRRGTLVYVPVGGGKSRSLVWVTPAGWLRSRLRRLRARYASARLSPDGKRVALQIADQSLEIWTWDFARRDVDAPDARRRAGTPQPAVDA